MASILQAPLFTILHWLPVNPHPSFRLFLFKLCWVVASYFRFRRELFKMVRLQIAAASQGSKVKEEITNGAFVPIWSKPCFYERIEEKNSKPKACSVMSACWRITKKSLLFFFFFFNLRTAVFCWLTTELPEQHTSKISSEREFQFPSAFWSRRSCQTHTE